MSSRSSAPPPPRSIPPARRSSTGLSSLAPPGELATLLTPLIADEEDRAFVARCIATEGPAHHRAASFALLKLLSEALDRTGGLGDIDVGEGMEVPFRLPPHLERHADADARYPIRLPQRALARLAPAGSREIEAFADALTDGPSHHALANVAMVCLIEALLQRLETRGAR